MYKQEGTYAFIEKVIKSDLIRVLWNKKEEVNALYTLAMVDYISHINNVPYYAGYNDLRQYKIEETVYPSEVIMLDKLYKTDKYTKKAYEECKNDPCGKFFIRYNLIERSITND